MATWNLRSLFKRGALQSTLKDLAKYKIQVAAVQETRWVDSGIHTMTTHALYYSGTNTNMHEFGTGFIVDTAFDHNIIGFVPINKYMCTLRLRTKMHKITLLNVHAPTETKEEGVKDEFYSELERVYNSIPTSDIKIVLGDFNAQIGKEQCFKNVAGTFSLHTTSNDNGCRVANFAISSGMSIRSTQFQRKDIHKVTWNSNDGRTQTQIDHVLIEKQFSNNIINVRSYRGTLHDSDHALVKLVFKSKWLRSNVRKSNGRPKFNVDKLKAEDTKILFQTRIEELLSAPEPEQHDMNLTVRKTTEIITNVAEQILGKVQGSRKTSYFDDECAKEVEKKKNAKLEMLQTKTMDSKQRYQRQSIQTYRFLRRKKRDYLNEEISNLETKSRNSNIRDFYKAVKKQRKGFQPQSIKINDQNGRLISDTNEIAQRWAEYFQDLLNRTADIQIPTTVYQTAEQFLEPPTYDEVRESISRLKDHKSPGEDNIPAELIKAAGHTLWTRLHQIITSVWEKEELPEDWLVGLLVPIHKKGSKTDCKNYRGICLLNASYKILANILYSRLVIYAEEIIGDYQSGFRPGRSTIDQIFTIRQIMEKAWEFNISIHQLFVDFKQAYDSIDRKALFEILEEFGIPAKLIRLIKATLTDTKCKILIQNLISDSFSIETGLRQGDGLSTILFNFALEKVIRALSINWKGTIFSTSKQITAFADDADLLGRGVLAVKESFMEMDTEAKKVGLQVSEDKTKYLTLDRKEGSRVGQNITMDEYNFEVVQSFKYLGSNINVSNDLDEEIKTRITQGNKCFYAMKHLFKSSLLSRSAKLRLYKTTIRPVVMYSS